MKFRTKTLSALIGIALVMTACGNDGNSEAPTKAEFIAQADRICERTDQVQKDGLRDYFSKRPNAVVSQAENEKVVLVVGLPAIETEIDELDELPIPDGDEDEIEAIIDGMEEAVDESEEDPGSLVNLKDGAGPFTEVGKLAEEYGFKACAFPL